MPCLQELTIVTYGSKTLMRLTLVDTPVSSLRLTRNGSPLGATQEDERASWVDGTIHLLRSTPRLEQFEISIPFDHVDSLSRAIAEDFNSCMELNTFIFTQPMGLTLGWPSYAKDFEADIEQMTSRISALLEQRRLIREST